MQYQNQYHLYHGRLPNVHSVHHVVLPTIVHNHQTNVASKSLLLDVSEYKHVVLAVSHQSSFFKVSFLLV